MMSRSRKRIHRESVKLSKALRHSIVSSLCLLMYFLSHKLSTLLSFIIKFELLELSRSNFKE